MTNHVRRKRPAPPPARSYGKGETLQITVTAEIVDGLVKEKDMELWLRHAIQHYHAFRAGHVGWGFIVGGIKPPTVQKQS